MYLGHRDTAVERHDRRRRDHRELVIQREDLPPVGAAGRRRVGVHGADRRLQLVRPGLVAAQARAHQILALADQGPVPPAAVLVGQPDQRAVGGGAGRAARLGQQQQRHQAEHLRLVRHQAGQQPGQPDRLGAQLGADQRVPGGSRVPLVEDQVDHGEHVRQPGGQRRVARHAVRDPRVSDLPLGPDQPLGDRRLGDQERAGDLGGLQPGHEPQGEGELRLGAQRRVAAGEDEPQPVIRHWRPLGRYHRLRAGLGPAWIRSSAACAFCPSFGGDGEGLLDRLFGEVDVAEEADQGGHGPPGALPDSALQGPGLRAGHFLSPPVSPGKPALPPAHGRPRSLWRPSRARWPGRPR